MNKLILIDGNSLLFRAYFAMMRPMVTADGIYTQGIFAFINMLNKILSDHEPDYIAVAFDMKEKTFRHEKYTEYKAGRAATPIELLTEIPILHDVLKALNIAVVEMPRYEADDLIGTIAARAEKDGFDTLVISGDKDELQLVDEHVRVLINKKGMTEFDLYDIPAMKERYNLTPSQFIDLKGLMGDKSDNIPGIPGVGEKKGIALLEQYETLEGVIEHAGEIKGKLGENVRDNIEQARMSKWLATINTEAPIDFDWDDFKYTEPDYSALIELYNKLEFNKFIRDLKVPSESVQFPTARFDEFLSDYLTVDISTFLNKTDPGDEVIIDVITDDNHIDIPEVTAIAMMSDDKKLYCFKAVTPLDTAVTMRQIASMNYRLIGFDLKRSLFSLISLSDAEFNSYYDVEIAEYLIDASRSKYLLDKIALRYLNTTIPEDPDEKLRLLCILQIRAEQEAVLKSLELDKLFYECEMPLVNTLALMEINGIKCDVSVLEEIGTEIDEKVSVLENAIYDNAGRKFNINSPKQLGVILFDELGITYPKTKGKTATYSTAADVLDKLSEDHDIVRNVLEYRKLSKLKSTYIDGLISLIGADGRIRPHFQQTVTATGRLSCVEPNLQNIPIRDEYGKLIRKAFVVTDENYVFVGSDYSQIELRVLASLSGDESMINAFREGKDIHRATAAKVFDIAEDEVTSLDRSRAKAVNFGVVYGMSGFGLSENLNISRQESQKYINDYFAKHPRVKEYLDDLVSGAEKSREVRTYFGRLRAIPEFSSNKFMEREAAKRLAMNTPIQGTAADIIKFAMNSVSNALRSEGLKSRMILQIHDELIVEGPESEENEVRDLLEKCMREAADMAVDLICDIHSGKTWLELK